MSGSRFTSALDFRLWHFSDMPRQPTDVRYWGETDMDRTSRDVS